MKSTIPHGDAFAKRNSMSSIFSRHKHITASRKGSKNKFVLPDGSVGILNENQTIAIEEGEKLRSSDAENKELLVIGPAGTGKSTIVRELLRRWRYIYGEGNVILSSPTHRANWVLKSMSTYKARRFGFDSLQKENPITLEVLMGAKLNDWTGKFVYPDVNSALKSSRQPPISKLDEDGVVVVDEASMMDFDEFKRIRQWREKLGFGIVYIGDAEQLPPVGMEKSLVFSAKMHEVKLTEVMRQRGGNPLLDLLTDIRMGENPHVVSTLNETSGEGIVLVNNRSAALQAIGVLSDPQIVRHNMNQLRVLAGRNSVVREWNSVIHNMLFPSAETPVSVGEVVIGYRNTEELHNGVEYLVTKVSDKTTYRHACGFSARGWHVYLTSDPESESCISIFVVCSTDETKYVEQFNLLMDKKQAAWKAWHESGRSKSKIKAAIMATKALDSFTGAVGIMNDISSNWSSGNLEESERSPLRRIFDLGYASTVHKAQGGTVNIVVVDMEDLRSFPGDATFKRKLVYTALSRASKSAIVVGSKFKTSEEKLSILVKIGSSPAFYSLITPNYIAEDASLYGRVDSAPLYGAEETSSDNSKRKTKKRHLKNTIDE